MSPAIEFHPNSLPAATQPLRKHTLRAALLFLLCLIPALSHAQTTQTITFTQPPPTSAYAGTSVLLAATATSGLPITFSVTSGPAQVSGANGQILTFIGVGSVIVQADQPGNTTYAAASTVKAPAVTITTLTEPVTTASSSVSTVVTFTTAGTLSQIAALTQGATASPNSDFSLTPTPVSNPTVCLAGNAYAAGDVCTLSFSFKPTRPGIRYGGITLADASGTLLANSYIYGYAIGPEVLYQPYQQSFVGNSLGQPSGVAINGNGDLFVSNEGGSGTGLVEIAANGTVSVIGIFDPGKDVAVDGSGNVFLVTEDTLYEVVAVNGSIPASPIIRTLANGFDLNGGGLAIDGSGNAWIATTPVNSTLAAPTGVVYVVYAVGGSIPANSAIHQIGPIQPSPTGVAVDQSGNVYISDELTPAIFEMLAVNGQVPANPTILKIGSGYVEPSNIRLDDFGDIFISDAGYPGVLEYKAVNGVVPATAPAVPIGSNFLYPQGLLVDDSGNVFVADGQYTQVVKLNYSTVPTLTFADTYIGHVSTDSPKTITYTNAGNAPLLFTPPLIGTNPSITLDPAHFTIDTALSTCPQLAAGSTQAVLAVGASCTDEVSFTPTAQGAFHGTFTTVDNDLSIPNNTQNIQLYGNGILIPPTINFLIPQHFVDDLPFTVSATSDSPAPITYSYVSGPATLTGQTVTLTGTAGNVTLKASQVQDPPYDAGSTSTTFAVVKHDQTIDFTQPPTPDLLTASPLTLHATATSGLPVNFKVLTGPGTVSGNQLTFTGFGQIVIAADQAGNNIYNAAPEVTRTIVVLDNRTTLTLTGTPNPVFVTNPITFHVTITSPDGAPTGTITLNDGTTTLTTLTLNGGAATFTTAALAFGHHNITAVYSGDAVFAPATSTPLTEIVEDFSITLASPTVTIPHGGTGVFNITFAPVGGTIMASDITLSITGNPDHSPLTFSPTIVAQGATTTQVTLTIATPDYPVGPWAQLSTRKLTLAFFAFIPLFGFTRKRRARIALLLAIALSFAVTSLSGCGSGWNTQPWPMTLTAQSGSLIHKTDLKLVSK